MNIITNPLILLTVLGLAIILSGCSGCGTSLECGEGLTLNDEEQCVPQGAITACGAGTVLVGSQCLPRGEVTRPDEDMSKPDAGTCSPDCSGRVCGPDGCDGSCGLCESLDEPFCDANRGQCTSMLCQPICLEGWECGGDGCGGQCGQCGAATPFCGADFTCQATCVPSCEGRSCGDDGCGGQCGQGCAGAQPCNDAGKCVPEAWSCAPNAYQDGKFCDCACGAVDPDCAANTSSELLAGCALRQRCGADGTCQDLVPAGWTCSPTRYGDGGACDCACGVLDPDCADSTKPIIGCDQLGVTSCSPDGSCGQCVPSCAGKSCGDDGCGGDCGQCGASAALCLMGQCVDRCNPTPVLCTLNACGDDSCGGSCGVCPNNEVCRGGQCASMAAPDSCVGRCGRSAPAGCSCAPGCAATGSCCADYVAACSACVPACANKNCGDDGCGGDCGVCDIASPTPYCEPTMQQCGPPPCLPQCLGKTCGDNGCGGSCGSCQVGDACFNDAGRCAPETWLCDPFKYNDGFCDCGCGAPDPDCAPAQLGAASCPSGVACVAGRCDMPRCFNADDCLEIDACVGAYYDTQRRFSGACMLNMSTMTGLGGMLCATAMDCNSNLCIEGVCVDHCVSDVDCFDPAVCVGVQPEEGGYRAVDPKHPAGWVSACVFINGTGITCTSSADCTMGSEECLAFVDGVTMQPRYLCAVPDANVLGMSCGANPTCSTNLQCAVNSVTQASTCARACPGGQLDCGAGESCSPITFNDNNSSMIGDDIAGAVCIP